MIKDIEDIKDLSSALKNIDKAVVLFYASWCPYSQKFLPIYNKMSAGKPSNYLRFLMDDNDEVADKYSIDVYPTVLFFEKGKLSKRLDGVAHEGLNEKKITDFIGMCKV